MNTIKVRLHELVEKYEANYTHHTSPQFNEAELRSQFLDPFLRFLDGM